MTPEVFAVECDALIDKAMVEVHGLLGDAPRVRVLQTIATGFFNLDPGRIASLAAIALIRLAEEQGTHAMTASSFEIAIEAAADENTKLRAQVAGLRQQRNEALAANYALLAERDEARQALREAGQRLAAVRDGT